MTVTIGRRLVVSFAGEIKGMAIEKIISFINAIGYSGILLGPVLIGFVAGRIMKENTNNK